MYKKILFLIVMVLFLQNCASLGEAGKVLRNEKVNTTDEFLIEKKGALSEPPDYTSLPLPESKKDENKKKIDNILNIESVNKETEKISGSIEEKILREIR